MNDQKKRRGFAAMDPDRVSEISRMGGKAAHVAGTAHKFTSEEAREAGRKGARLRAQRSRSRAAAIAVGFAPSETEIDS